MGIPDRPVLRQYLYYLLVAFSLLVILNSLIGTRLWQIIPSLALATGILLIQVFFGMSVQWLLNHRPPSLLPALAFGMIWTSLFFLACAACGWLTLWTAGAYCVLTFLPILLARWKGCRWAGWLPQSPGRGKCCLYLMLPIALIYASLPSSFFDSLVYHLGIPNLYVQSGGMVALPHFLYANTSIYYEMNLIPAVLGGDLVPRLYHLALAILFLLSLAAFARRFFGIRKEWLPAFILLTSPMGLFLATTVKNDLPAALFILAGIAAYLEGRFHNSGLFFGFAIGVKYFSFLPIVIFLLLLVVTRRAVHPRALLLVGLVAVIILSPLLVKNTLHTGNPVYPFLDPLFAPASDSPAKMELIRRDVGRIVNSPAQVIKLPVTLSFQEWGLGGLAGIQYLVFLPFLVLVRKTEPFLLIFALLVLVCGSFFTGSLRFMFIAFLLLSFYVTRVLEQHSRPLMWGIFAVIVAINLVTSLAYHERIYRSHLLHTGKVNSREYLARLFPTYPAFLFINRQASKNDRILLIGETRNYYLKKPYLVSSALDTSPLKNLIAGGDSAALRSKLIRSGFRYVIFNEQEHLRIQKQYHRFSPDELQRISRLINHLPTLFREGPVSVHRLIP